MAPETSASVHSLSNKQQAEAPLKWLLILALFCQKWPGTTLDCMAQNCPHCEIGLGILVYRDSQDYILLSGSLAILAIFRISLSLSLPPIHFGTLCGYHILNG